MANGKGCFYYVNGDFYEGEWRNNSINGYGKFTSIMGTSYEGHWEND